MIIMTVQTQLDKQKTDHQFSVFVSYLNACPLKICYTITNLKKTCIQMRHKDMLATSIQYG